MLFTLDIAGSEWFIILLTIIIVFVPSKITSISKTIGKFIGEYEKTKNNLINEKIIYYINNQQLIKHLLDHPSKDL